MENASKALIIAGAILISILLISVGVMIMGSTEGMQDTMATSMSEQEIEAFNSKFLKYEGTRVKASNVKTLISKIASSNTANEATSADDEKFVAVSGIGVTTDAARAAVNSTQTYTVTCTIDSTTGLVTAVNIAEN